jgi:hypothetical protein
MNRFRKVGREVTEYFEIILEKVTVSVITFDEGNHGELFQVEVFFVSYKR